MGVFKHFAVLPECSSCPCLFQRRCLAHIIAKSYPIQTIIQLLSTIGSYYLIGNFFANNKNYFEKGQQKSRPHRHQESAGALLSLQKNVLCNRLWNSKKGLLVQPIHSLTVPQALSERWRYFLLAYRVRWVAFATFSFIYHIQFSVTVKLSHYHYTEQMFWFQHHLPQISAKVKIIFRYFFKNTFIFEKQVV